MGCQIVNIECWRSDVPAAINVTRRAEVPQIVARRIDIPIGVVAERETTAIVIATSRLDAPTSVTSSIICEITRQEYLRLVDSVGKTLKDKYGRVLLCLKKMRYE